MRVRIPPSAPNVSLARQIVTCRRCAQTAEPMPRPPFGGALGQTIHETVCNDCWRAWVGEQTKIINEMRLSLGDPKAREILDRQMRLFLKLEEAQ